MLELQFELVTVLLEQNNVDCAVFVYSWKCKLYRITLKKTGGIL